MSDPNSLTSPNLDPTPSIHKLPRRGGAADAKYDRLLTAALLALSLMGAAVFLKTRELRSPDFLGEYGVVGNATTLLRRQAPNGTFTPFSAWLLRQMTLRNRGNQDAALGAGVMGAANAILASNATSWGRLEAVLLLTELMRGNSDAKDEALAEGVVAELISLVKEDASEKLTGSAAAAIAIYAADTNSARKKKAGSSGGVAALVQHLEGAKSAGSRSYVNSAWALANLAADSPPNQALLMELGSPELLTRLLGSGPDVSITQPAAYAAANLAAKSAAAQDALRETGCLEVLVKMLEEGTAGLKSRASEPFHTEVLEHVAELQRSDPAVRAALVEVGGLEELLGLIEQESEIKPSGTAREKQLVLVEDGEDEDAMHSVRRLVRDLQDEVDSQTGLLSDVKLPSLVGGPSGARILGQPKLRSRQNVLAVVAWALSNIVADNPANQDAARGAGAIEALVKLLEGAEDAFVAKGALGCISSLVQGNAINKQAVREANGVQGLVKLLASNPADKEVLQATAQALKQMTAERPAYEIIQRGGSRWLRVLGRQGASLLFERFGYQVSPTAFSIFLGVVGGGTLLFAFLSLCLTLLRSFRGKGGVRPERKME